MILQFAFFAVFLRCITTEAALLGRITSLLGVYVRLFGILREHGKSSLRDSPALQEPELASILALSDQAWNSIRELATTMKYFQMGQSMMGAVVLNGTVFWHLHCVRLLENWRKRHGNEVEQWFDALATMDALCSMAGFAFQHPHFIQPDIVDSEELVLRASELAHPFLEQDNSVANSLTLDTESGNLVVITGANMAGKSTFLRAIGINAVLALVGLPVCASAFEISLCEVLTSMRTSDSLEKHESYFFAELKRLQWIVERLRGGHRALVLLDEILRGTNSADKKSGTVGLLQQLLVLPTLAVVATHDTEIGALESEYPTLVRNYCFEGEIHDGELTFDYLLRRGVANNKNATFLMQQMGIVRHDKQ
jgi:DNA mismatch repair ATPase MutS